MSKIDQAQISNWAFMKKRAKKKKTRSNRTQAFSTADLFPGAQVAGGGLQGLHVHGPTRLALSVPAGGQV